MTNVELQAARMRMGITQGKLGEIMGMPQSAIARLENGTRRITKIQAAFVRHLVEVRCGDDDGIGQAHFWSTIGEGFNLIVNLHEATEEAMEDGDLLLCKTPFMAVPLVLFILLKADGRITFFKWKWLPSPKRYDAVCVVVGWRHLDGAPRDTFCFPYILEKGVRFDDETTTQQRETVAGMLSGRIKWRGGISLAPSDALCEAVQMTMDEIAREEQRIGRKIYFA